MRRVSLPGQEPQQAAKPGDEHLRRADVPATALAHDEGTDISRCEHPEVETTRPGELRQRCTRHRQVAAHGRVGQPALVDQVAAIVLEQRPERRRCCRNWPSDREAWNPAQQRHRPTGQGHLGIAGSASCLEEPLDVFLAQVVAGQALLLEPLAQAGKQCDMPCGSLRRVAPPQ